MVVTVGQAGTGPSGTTCSVLIFCTSRTSCGPERSHRNATPHGSHDPQHTKTERTHRPTATRRRGTPQTCPGRSSISRPTRTGPQTTRQAHVTRTDRSTHQVVSSGNLPAIAAPSDRKQHTYRPVTATPANHNHIETVGNVRDISDRAVVVYVPHIDHPLNSLSGRMSIWRTAGCAIWDARTSMDGRSEHPQPIPTVRADLERQRARLRRRPARFLKPS